MYLKIKKFRPLLSRTLRRLKKKTHSSARKRKHAESFFKSKLKKHTFYFLRNLKKKLFEHKLNKNTLHKGHKFALKTLEPFELKTTPLISVIKLLKRFLKNQNLEEELRMRIFAFPIFQKTSKPKEIRMGKGKGSLSEKVYNAKNGKVLFGIRRRKKKFFFLMSKFGKFFFKTQCLDLFDKIQFKFPVKTLMLKKFW